MKHGFKTQADTVLGVDVFHITDFTGKPRGVLMSEQDAQIFCEASTIHFDTDLTPSALLAQRDRLAAELDEYARAMTEMYRFAQHWTAPVYYRNDHVAALIERHKRRQAAAQTEQETAA